MNASEPYNERELLYRLKGGSQAAFKAVYDRYADDVFHYSISFLKEKEIAEEAVQEAFIKIWKTHDRIDPDRSFEAYLFTIVRNTVFNSLKKIALDRELFHRIADNTASFHNDLNDHLDWGDYKYLADEAISLLPESRRKIFLLLFEEGLSNEEISKKLGISQSTVRSQIQSALKDIRLYFQTHGDLYFPLLLIFYMRL